jgi:hypothetical protein
MIRYNYGGSLSLITEMIHWNRSYFDRILLGDVAKVKETANACLSVQEVGYDWLNLCIPLYGAGSPVDRLSRNMHRLPRITALANVHQFDSTVNWCIGRANNQVAGRGKEESLPQVEKPE